VGKVIRRGATFDPGGTGGEFRECFFDRFGRRALDLLQGLTHGEGAWQTEGHVDVVGHSADQNGVHVILAGDAAEITPDALLDIMADPWPAIFGTEDQNENGGRCRCCP
jgi:hypothetical protein